MMSSPCALQITASSMSNGHTASDPGGNGIREGPGELGTWEIAGGRVSRQCPAASSIPAPGARRPWTSLKLT